MNKFLAALAVLAVLSVLSVLAGTPKAVPLTVGISGAASFTNNTDYYGLRLISVEVFDSGTSNNVVTVKRVRNSRTNTVSTVTCASSVGSDYPSNRLWSFKGDRLDFSSSPATNYKAELTFELNE